MCDRTPEANMIHIRGKVWQKTTLPLPESKEPQMDLCQNKNLCSWASAQLVRLSTNSCSSLLFPDKSRSLRTWDRSPQREDPTVLKIEILEERPPATLAGLTDQTALGMWGPGLEQSPGDRKNNPLSRCSPRRPVKTIQVCGA